MRPQIISYEGKKVRLRPLKAEDKEYTIIWRNDPEVRDISLGYRFPITEPMESKWYDTYLDDTNKNTVFFAIEDLSDGKFVGIIGLREIDWISRTSYFSIIIGEQNKQGRGIGSDAMHILYRYAFECLSIRKICLEVASFNERAIKFYKNFGFKIEGTLKEQIYYGNNFYDMIIMSFFKDDYYKKYSGN